MPIELTNLQGLNSKTFKGPAELIAAQEATVPELLEWNEVNNPQHPLFRYWDGSENKHILYSEAVPAIRKAAHHVIGDVIKAQGQANLDKQPVVAILALSGQFM